MSDLTRGIHAYVDPQRWRRVRELEVEHNRKKTPSARFDAACALHEWVRVLHPGWPHPNDRDDAVAEHQRIRAILNRLPRNRTTR